MRTAGARGLEAGACALSPARNTEGAGPPTPAAAMPLLHRKPFERKRPPADLWTDERFFYCRVTNEIFRDYDEFFERTILCNSLVWSCAITGKPGLTYQEAVESEKKARRNIQNFPEPLIAPVLYLATRTRRVRLHEVCEDLYAYLKDRFFVGETVDVLRNSGTRLQCIILEVKPPPKENGMVNGHTESKPVGAMETIVISDSDEEPEPPKTSTQNGRPTAIDPSLFKYKVKPIKQELYESVTVKACQISRKPALFSRERLKLFLKLHCEQHNGVQKPKATSVLKYKVCERSFSQAFPDDPPAFASSLPAPQRRPPKNRVVMSPMDGFANRPIIGADHYHAAMEREQLLALREEMQAMAYEKAKFQRERYDVIEAARRREREERDKEREEMRKIMEVERLKKKEEKERQKIERDKEREKLREEKRKYAEYVKLWSKPREDLECDDLKELPAPTPVKTRLPPDCFGDALMVLEFLHAFGELFDLQDEFPEGISLEVLEEALVGNNADGPLCELLFFFLTAIFEAMAEEEEQVAKEQIAEADTKDLTEALDEDADPTKSALSAVASLAAAWPQLHQGCSLKGLDLDSCTLSEILRLHILASGADVTAANAKYRWQKRGGFDATDDAGVELRQNHPGLLKKLSTASVYDLSPAEKLKILHALCGKLLTLVSTRDFIEDYVEILRQSKQEFRELKAEQNRRGREEAAAKIRKRKEEKLKEHEMKMKDYLEKLKEHENRSFREAGGENMIMINELKERDHDSASEDEGGVRKGSRGNKKQNGLKAGSRDLEVDLQEPLSADEEAPWKQELQQKEEELLEKIQSATTCTNVFPLGRDRLYRRYWVFAAVPGLFVEEDYSGLTEDMLLHRPASVSQQTEASQGSATFGETKDSSESTSLSPSASMALQPVKRPNRWFYYGSSSQLDELIESLNTRGLRESALKEVLVQEKFRICEKLIGACVERYHITEKSQLETKPPARGRGQDIIPLPAEKHMELRLRDLLLDIEDRIYQGTLGTLKVSDRSAWRDALESGRYENLSEEMKENGVSDDELEMDLEDQTKLSVKERVLEIKTEGQNTGSSSTPQLTNNIVHYLALALLQVEEGVERRFLKPPLGDTEDGKKDQKVEKKKKDDRKRKDEDQSSERDDSSDNGRLCRTVLDRWRESLIASGSLSQIFLHLSTLERSIIWAKSILNTRCKMCRRKGDAECMVLCDICDRGYHTYCVRPKLKGVPEGDWFCPDCRPKERIPRVSSRQKKSVESDEDEEEEDEEEGEEDEEEEEQEEEEEEEQEGSEAEEAVDASEDDEEEEEESEEEQSLSKRGRQPGRVLQKSRGGRPRGGRGALRQDMGRTSCSQNSTPKQAWHSARGRGRGRGQGPGRGRGSSKKAMSEPIPETKPTSRMSSRSRQSYPSPELESSDESVTEEVKSRGRGRGRGRGRWGRGKGRGSKTADNTPDRSPYTFRLFQLDGADCTPQGRHSFGSPQDLALTISETSSRGRKRQSTDRLGVLPNPTEHLNRRSSGRAQGVHELSAFEQLVVELVRHEDSWPFMKLVSKLQVPDYYDIIKRPIALNIIREKVNKCEYKLASELIDDIELMFTNCFEYNPIETNEAKAGARLQAFFHSQAQKLGLDLTASRADPASSPHAKKSRI